VSRNADTIRQGTDATYAFMRGELSNEALAEGLDPQIEMIWQDRQTYPDFPQHLRGLAEVIAFLEQYRERWIDLVYESLEVIEAPDGRVVALVRQSARGRQSGVPIVVHFFVLHTIRDGKLCKIEYFRHRADALHAAGLGEQAMSSNLDLVRSIFADWERGDFSRTDWAHPEIEYVIADGPIPGRSSGLTGMMEGGRTFLSAWEHWCAMPEEYRELDGERVLVLFDARGRGKTSGVELQTARAKGASLFRIRGGKVWTLTWYFDRDQALTDLGLEG
jgi:ketosteroid isomerase-like protein